MLYTSILQQNSSYHSLYIFRKDQEWKKFRSVMDKKMMRPKEVSCYSDRVNGVADDLIQRLQRCRNDNGIVPDIEKEINKFTSECKLQ